MSTLAELREARNNKPETVQYTLLPEGPDNYEVTAVKLTTNPTGKKALDLTIKSSSGTGQHRIWLQPMSDSEKAYDTFQAIMVNLEGVFGWPEQASGEAIAKYAAQAAQSMIGYVLSMNVKHRTYTSQYGEKTTSDSYINAVVQKPAHMQTQDAEDVLAVDALTASFDASPLDEAPWLEVPSVI